MIYPQHFELARPIECSGEENGAACKMQDQALELQMAGFHKPAKTTDAKAPIPISVPVTAVPGENVTVPLIVDGQERSYQLYWPKNHAVSEKLPVVFEADGLSTAHSSPAQQMGVQDGIFSQADTDGFAVATLLPKRTDWFGLGAVTMHFWNTKDSVLGFDAKQQDDTRYAAAAQDDLAKHFNVDPSHNNQFCIGFSNGGQLCSTMDVKAVSLNSSTQLKDRKLARDGQSAVIFAGMEDQILPYEGGLYGPTSFAGFNIWWIQHHLPNGKLNESAPSELRRDYVDENHLTQTGSADNQYFLKRDYGSNENGVKVTEYQIKHPYGGHSYFGGHAKNSSGYVWSANTNVIPRQILDSTHIASCFFGLRKNADCSSEAADH